MTPVGTTHVQLDDDGIAWIDDTNVKVIEVVVDRVGWQWSPEAIPLQHPHLSLAQIHAALAYYYDHQAEFDALMARDTQEVEARRARAGESPVAKRLREDDHPGEAYPAIDRAFAEGWSDPKMDDYDRYEELKQ